MQSLRMGAGSLPVFQSSVPPLWQLGRLPVQTHEGCCVINKQAPHSSILCLLQFKTQDGGACQWQQRDSCQMQHNEGSASDELQRNSWDHLSIYVSLSGIFVSGFGHHSFYFSTFSQRNTEVQEAVMGHMTIGWPTGLEFIKLSSILGLQIDWVLYLFLIAFFFILFYFF